MTKRWLFDDFASLLSIFLDWFGLFSFKKVEKHIVHSVEYFFFYLVYLLQSSWWSLFFSKEEPVKLTIEDCVYIINIKQHLRVIDAQECGPTMSYFYAPFEEGREYCFPAVCRSAGLSTISIHFLSEGCTHWTEIWYTDLSFKCSSQVWFWVSVHLHLLKLNLLYCFII